jgi:hypothetical protein
MHISDQDPDLTHGDHQTILECKNADREHVVALFRLGHLIDGHAAAASGVSREPSARWMARVVPGLSRRYARRIMHLRRFAGRCLSMGLNLGQIEFDITRSLLALSAAGKRVPDFRLPILFMDLKRLGVEQFIRIHCRRRGLARSSRNRRRRRQVLGWILRWLRSAEKTELGLVAAETTRLARVIAAGDLVKNARARCKGIFLGQFRPAGNVRTEVHP